MAPATPDKPKDEKPAKPAPKPAAKPAPKRAAKPESVIYLGPRLPGQAFMPGQVYRGGPPEISGGPDKDVERVKALFVPISDLARAKKELADPASAIAKAYRAVAENWGG